MSYKSCWGLTPLAHSCSRFVGSVFILFSCLSAFGTQQIVLTWDANADGQTAGYNVYAEDATGALLSKTDVGASTTATVTNLADGSTYGFHVTAYNSQGVESDSSNKIVYQVPVTNKPPIADNKTVQTLEDHAVIVGLSGSDPDGDALTYFVLSIPSHGTLSGTTPNLVYAPVPNFNGTDSFTYRVTDGWTNSNPATVIIAVMTVNDPPVANSKSVHTLPNQPLSIQLTGQDADGDGLSFVVVTLPIHGTLSGIPPNLIYTPAPNYLGPDDFAFVVNDGSVDSSHATVSISVASAGNRLKVRRH